MLTDQLAEANISHGFPVFLQSSYVWKFILDGQFQEVMKAGTGGLRVDTLYLYHAAEIDAESLQQVCHPKLVALEGVRGGGCEDSQLAVLPVAVN